MIFGLISPPPHDTPLETLHKLYFIYLNVFLILTDEKIFFYITFTPTAYVTNDPTIIHRVYKPDFAVWVPFFHDRKFAIKSAAVFGLVFFRVNAHSHIVITW